MEIASEMASLFPLSVSTIRETEMRRVLEAYRRGVIGVLTGIVRDGCCS